MANNYSNKEMEIEEEEDDERQNWSDWESEDGVASEPDMLCLFCDRKFISIDSLFNHLRTDHDFNFQSYRKGLNMDFYSCFKFINYVRFMVADNRMDNSIFSEGLVVKGDESKHPWNDDKFLTPFLNDDPLLYSFEVDFEDGEDGDDGMKSLSELEKVCVEDGVDVGLNVVEKENGESLCGSFRYDGMRRLVEIKKVDRNYFGSYSSFGIHREMLSDKVRTDAYEQAICKNPSLLNGAVVLDVGCGTGVLSLFAARAGASTVTAVDGSEKMSAVATQIVKDNAYDETIKVLHSMIEDLEKFNHIKPQSIDVIVSEWMGYCLHYESMLSSVLFARDKWLKPGGAILPDTATMFAAGFGRGCTSLPFWENVYGLDMSCVGKELIEEAARVPIVDVVDSRDIVTNTVVLQDFDIVTMTLEQMDFTSTIELEAKGENPQHCYGIVIWFDTGFTDRFCKETPTILSTSPYNDRTHWSQTILTFNKPITLGLEKVKDMGGMKMIGSDGSPAYKICSRISIVRGATHRSIDISMENLVIDHDGRKRNLPIQMFALD